MDVERSATLPLETDLDRELDRQQGPSAHDYARRWWTLAARAMMGVGAAFVMPATLSILAHVFPPEQRPRAIAVWAGVAGVGVALGGVVSGALLEWFWWGTIFLINVVMVTVALVVGYFLIPRSREKLHAPLDPLGALLSIVGLGALVYGIIEAPDVGWGSAQSVATFVAAVGAGLAIVATTSSVSAGYLAFAIGVVVQALGMGITTAPSTGAIMRSLPLHKAGVGSAVNDTTRELGGALGVAVLGSLVASQFRSSLRDAATAVPEPATHSLAEALRHAQTVGGSAGADLADAAWVAFVNAFDATMWVAVGVAVAAAAIVAFLLRARATRFEEVYSHADAPPSVPAVPSTSEAS